MTISITQHSKNQENLTKSPGKRQSTDDIPKVTQMLELLDKDSAAAVLISLHEVKWNSLEMKGKTGHSGTERQALTKNRQM